MEAYGEKTRKHLKEIATSLIFVDKIELVKKVDQKLILSYLHVFPPLLFFSQNHPSFQDLCRSVLLDLIHKSKDPQIASVNASILYKMVFLLSPETLKSDKDLQRSLEERLRMQEGMDPGSPLLEEGQKLFYFKLGS